MISVAVAGAFGKMGRVAAAAMQSTDGVSYVGGFARSADAAHHVVDDFDALLALRPDVVLDLTTLPGSFDFASRALRAGVRPVIGVTGYSDAQRQALDTLAKEHERGCLLVPNFSIGALLMMRFAREASTYFPTAEIVELHHDRKMDAPSGTARLTADRMHEHAGREVPIHSVRLRGISAHQEVLLSGEGELLTVRHDAFGRDAYVPGMVACVRAVMTLTGLHIGLESAL